VVVVVSDLSTAESSFRSLGFVVKPGHRHANGLRNAHIKFADGSALELMSIDGHVTDEVAAGYAEFLRSGEGAAFAAVEADLDRVAAAATALGVGWEISSAGAYSWLTLADSTPVFFIAWSQRPLDPDSLTTQLDDASGISSVRLAATPEFECLLAELGAQPCPAAGGPESVAVAGNPGRSRQRIETIDGSSARFSIREVTLRGSADARARGLDPERTHGVRIVIAPPTPFSAGEEPGSVAGSTDSDCRARDGG
jgi:hypothetical protein